MNVINEIKKVRKILYTFKNDIKYSSMDRKKTFDYIYEKNIWGGGKKRNGKQFYSGPGSYNDAYVEPYCNLIRKFIVENNITKIVDLGCGDFHVASKFIDDSVSYVGIDIVQKMIDYHNKKYGKDNIHFHCMDIVEDNLPSAELCLVRQVLQHLSNEEVRQVLAKSKKYKYMIVTEHIVDKKCAKKINVDKVHGSHTRVERQSGLYLDEEPFGMKIETLLDIPYGKKNERLVSILIRNKHENVS